MTHAQLAEVPGVALMSMILFFIKSILAVVLFWKNTPAPPKLEVLADAVKLPVLPKRIVLLYKLTLEGTDAVLMFTPNILFVELVCGVKKSAIELL